MGNSFLGTTTDRKKAFPNLKSLNLKISQSEVGFSRLGTIERTYNENNFPSFINCSNPKCKQGGLELQNIIEFHDSGNYTFPCNGHEGSAQGRRKGHRCLVSFNVELIAERK